MPKFRILVARDVSEYQEIEIEAKNELAAEREALRKVTEESETLASAWDLGSESENERVVYCEELEHND